MKTNLKLLIVQTLLLILVFSNCYLVVIYLFDLTDSIYSNFDFYYSGFVLNMVCWLLFMISLFIFLPLTFLYFMRIKKGNLRILNRIFRPTCWFFAITLFLFFVLIILEIFIAPIIVPLISGEWSIFSQTVSYYLSSSYFYDTEFGFFNDLKELSIYLPNFIIVLLLYLSIKVNKLLVETNKQA